MNPLVSVVIPVYNVEKYLNRCIQSVVDQTYPELEIILVDDGSPDNCPQMCDLWADRDSRIKVIHKENEGQGVARSLGIDIALGEYITFFDSDDFVDVTLVERCVESAIAHNSDVVIYGRKSLLIDGQIKDNPINTPTDVFLGKTVQEDLLPSMLTYKMGFGITSCRLYKLNTLRKYGIRFKSEREYVSEDTRFSLELFSKELTVSIVPLGLYYYCERTDSFSRAYNDDRQNKNDVFLFKNVEFAKSAGLPYKVVTHLMVRYHFFTIAALKQVFHSDLNKKDKKVSLYKIFKNKTLHTTLGSDVLKLENPALRMFFYSIKFRCYFLSNLLLRVKMSKGNKIELC